MTKVCHMSSAHRGLDVRIFHKECVSLARAGYEMHLVIAASSADVTEAAAKGVTSHALPSPGSRLARMFKQAWRCYRIARKLDADIYHFHDPELIPYGMLLKMAGKRVIYDVHEDVPRDIESKEWLPRWMRRPVARLCGGLEHFGAKHCFSIITATPYIENRFRRFNRLALAIKNYPLPDELAPAGGQRACAQKVCYAGSISRLRGMRELIEALPLVPDVRLTLCGRFADPEFEVELRAMPGWKQVDYRGHVGRGEVKRAMEGCSAGVVTLHPTSSYVDSLPIKMFEYMSAELPVIASDFPLWREIVDGAQAGICVDPLSSQAIASAIRDLVSDPIKVENMGKAGRRAVLEKYNWPNEAANLVEFYKRLQ